MIKSIVCSTFLFLLFVFFIGCSSNDNPTLSESNFISMYARLTIINELNIDKEYHDKLIEELLLEFNIQVADIQKSVDFYQKNPQKWLKILEKVKDQISEYKKVERKTKSEVPEQEID